MLRIHLALCFFNWIKGNISQMLNKVTKVTKIQNIYITNEEKTFRNHMRSSILIQSGQQIVNKLMWKNTYFYHNQLPTENLLKRCWKVKNILCIKSKIQSFFIKTHPVIYECWHFTHMLKQLPGRIISRRGEV